MILDKGTVNIYSTANTAAAGNMASAARTPKGELWYGERSVGAVRYWTAYQATEQIDMVIRVLRCFEITTSDICVLGTDDFRILQVQPVKDEESGEQVYDLSINRIGGGQV